MEGESSVGCQTQDPPDWQEVLTHWRGSELQNYFTRILEDNLNAIIKPQYVDNIPKAVKCAPLPDSLNHPSAHDVSNK
jgi:ATP-binding cassette subfamily E protein 1